MVTGYDKEIGCKNRSKGTQVRLRQSENPNSNLPHFWIKQTALWNDPWKKILLFPINTTMILQKENPQLNGYVETKNIDSRDTTSQPRRTEMRMERAIEGELNSELYKSDSFSHP